MTWKVIIGRLLLVCMIAFGAWGWRTELTAHAGSQCEPDGLQTSGAVYRICMPIDQEWNGDLVVYAHGYVAFNEPIAIPEDQLHLPGQVSIPDIATGLGFAFATTSYSVNGLAVRQGMDDLLDLVRIFSATHGSPGRVYLVGASEGGIITALALERHADVFHGGLSACGPVGNFWWQINYWGDVRVLFDYFFPGVLPGSPIAVPPEVIAQWDTVYKPNVEIALRSEPVKTGQLLKVARIPRHPLDANKNIEALLDLLWYHVFATNDGIAKLGGQPFDNSQRIYRGSTNDRLLNQMVARIQADPAAIAEINAHYQTTGNLGGPLITLHTLQDPIVPYWHEPFYRYKIEVAGAQGLHKNIPILPRYGHCNFSAPQVLVAFMLLVREVTGQVISDADQVLSSPEEKAEYRDLAAPLGLGGQ
jgi:pimeloyl-ACP methyl ester carboxylesterase